MSGLDDILGEAASSERHPFEQDLERLPQDLKEDTRFLEELYAALCNNFWLRKDRSYTHPEGDQHSLVDEQGEYAYSCSWRYAGGVVDDLQRYGHVAGGAGYLCYYCAGGEGNVTPRVQETLGDLGWKPQER